MDVIEKPRKPWVAGWLSLVQPGLGHVYCGKWKEGLQYYLLSVGVVYFLAILILLVAMPVGAVRAWVDGDGNMLKDAPERKSSGEFGAWLLLIDDERRFFDEWMIPGTLDVATISEAKRKTVVTALVIFSGCLGDEEGNCNLIADFNIAQPDGSSYATVPNQVMLVGRPKPKDGTLQMGEAFIRIRVEPHDSLGEYKIQALVRDLNSELTLDLQASFVAKESVQVIKTTRTMTRFKEKRRIDNAIAHRNAQELEWAKGYAKIRLQIATRNDHKKHCDKILKQIEQALENS